MKKYLVALLFLLPMFVFAQHRFQISPNWIILDSNLVFDRTKDTLWGISISNDTLYINEVGYYLGGSGDSSYVRSGTGIRVDSSGNTYTVNVDTSEVVMFNDTIGAGSTGKIETKYHATSTFEPKITAGTTAQYWRGDKSWQTLPTYKTDSTWSSITLGRDPANVSGQLNFIASDNDQANIAINTSDQITFNNANNGYLFNGDIKVNTNGDTALISTFKDPVNDSYGENIFLGGGGQSTRCDPGLEDQSLGSFNTALGFHALDSNVSGRYNTSIGYQSMMLASDEYLSTAVGYKSLYKSEAAAANTAIGAESLSHNTLGSSNVAVGYGSLYNNINGSMNTAIGNGSLYQNYSGSPNNNTAIGYNALWSNQSGANNTAIGYGALQYNETGSNNISLGYNSGGIYAGHTYWNLSNRMYLGSEDSTASGIYFDRTITKNWGRWNGTMYIKTVPLGTSDSLLVKENGLVKYKLGSTAFPNYWTKVGNYLYPTHTTVNMFLGSLAGRDNTSGQSNIAIGVQALTTNTSGFSNIAIGDQVLRNTYNLSGNIGIGSTVFTNHISGEYNTAIGTSSLYLDEEGIGNTTLGYFTMTEHIKNDYNTAIGAFSMQEDSIGYNNTAVGASSLILNKSGYNNIAIGYEAGYHETGSNKMYLGSHDSLTVGIYWDRTTTKNWGRWNGTMVLKTAPATTGTADSALWRDYTTGLVKMKALPDPTLKANVADPTFTTKIQTPIATLTSTDTASGTYPVGSLFYRVADSAVYVKIRMDGVLSARWKKLTP